MACPICDNKPPNCDCTELERRQHEEIERLTAELERHKMTEKKLKLYVWHGFEPGWSGGLAFALAYTKDEARAAVEKVWRAKVNEWGRLRVHRVEAGRAEAMAGGG